MMKRGEFKEDTLQTLLKNVTIYPQYNNNMLKNKIKIKKLIL
jgi:hypothetical protein